MTLIVYKVIWYNLSAKISINKKNDVFQAFYNYTIKKKKTATYYSFQEINLQF